MSAATMSRKRARTWLAIAVSTALLVLGMAIAIPLVVAKMRASAQAVLQETLVAKPLAQVRAGKGNVTVSHLDLLQALSQDASCIQSLSGVVFSGVRFREQDAQYVAQLKNLTSIGFYDCELADSVLSGCNDLPLTSVFFEMTKVAPNSIEKLGSIPTLTTFTLEQNLTEEQVHSLQALPNNVVVKSSFPLDAYE